jgi:hypothetical protein
MTDRPPKHMTDPVQDQTNLDALVAGIGTSGQEEIAKRPCEELEPTESPMNPHADGENPTFTMPPFANGVDLRNRG